MKDEQESNLWKLIKNYFEYEGLIHMQIDSFNEFINVGIQNCSNEQSDISFYPKKNQHYSAHFGNITVMNPGIIEERTLKRIFPNETRTRSLNYDSTICCDITETIVDNGVKEVIHHYRVPIGRVPVMVGSDICNLFHLSADERVKVGECEFDKGGYFIISGHERVIVSQIRNNYQLMIYKQKSDKYSYIGEIRSMSEETGHSVQVKSMITIEKNFMFSIPYIKEHILAGIIFKALGCSSDDIKYFIGADSDDEDINRYINIIVRDSDFIKTTDEALNYIGQYSIHIIAKDKRQAYAKQVIETELFPHMGTKATSKDKAMFIGYIIKKLILSHLGKRLQDDRDNYGNKRIETTGVLCTDLFRNLYKRFISTIKLQFEKKKSNPDILSIISKINVITLGLRHCFATGNWGVQKNAYTRTGVSQILSRMTFGATISHLRRIIFPSVKEGKDAKIRRIHPSQFGYICPSETPEGQTVGIVMNFSMMTKITRRIPTVIVRQILENCPNFIKNDQVEIENIKNLVFIMLNENIIGCTENPIVFVDHLKHLRNIRYLHPEISISYNMLENEIKICSDSGRCIRPLFKVFRNDSENTSTHQTINLGDLDWRSLIEKNYIQYMDNSELENCVVAMTPEDLKSDIYYDYCEIHPSMLLGVMGNIIPFPDHSPSPRNCYQCSMGKQAIGFYATSYKNRTDTISNVLDYPQKPIVSTKPSNFMGFNDMPSGINAVVAIMAYTGYNQEDSVILNKSSVDRGLFTVTSYHTLVETEKKGGMYVFENICVPPENSVGKNIEDDGYFKRKYDNYSLLNEHGIIREKIPVKKGDVIVGKIITKSSKNGVDVKKDCSVTIKQGEEGIIDRVYMSTTPSGYKMVKIVIRRQRIPEIGDKFASRAAQKGTVGAIYNQEDMPFNSEGISPDIIINPHCIPSRMTINQLMECVLGKACVLNGTYGDATPFTSSSTDNITEKICDQLAKAGMKTGIGYNRYGWEYLQNGFTGEMIRAKIFMGPTYYQRLKHMVSDKIHARANGHVTTLTRQPLEGRSRDGGLRFGEMERDAMIAHGSSRFLKERLFDCSDPYQITVCDQCGMITTTPTDCSVCEKDKVTLCNIPYAAKLLFQELMSMGIKIMIKPKD
jgi:DNA-directed RNA polymerase II subunit RPB2